MHEVATVEDLTRYGSDGQPGFGNEPIRQSGTLELPKYDPSKNYFEGYWRMFLRNE